MTSKIALLLDGSESDATAVSELVRLPLPEDAEVSVVQVRAADETPEPTDAVAQLESRGWKVDTRVVGPSWSEVTEALTSLSAHLVVTSSHHGGANSRFRLGTLPKKVVRDVRSSLLVCRENESNGPVTRVLVAYDGSETAKAAVERVGAMAWPEGTEITLLSVLTVATTMFRRDILERLTEAWQEHKEEVTAELEDVAASLQGSTATISTKVLDGGTDPSDEILQAAQLLDTDLIVAGYNGRSGLMEALLGSVASQLIEYAPCSVWVVKR